MTVAELVALLLKQDQTKEVRCGDTSEHIETVEQFVWRYKNRPFNSVYDVNRWEKVAVDFVAID